MNLRSGNLQVEMEEVSKEKMTFTVEYMGLYECNRMAFGLTNALIFGIINLDSYMLVIKVVIEPCLLLLLVKYLIGPVRGQMWKLR